MGNLAGRMRAKIEAQPWLWLFGLLICLSAALLMTLRANLGLYLDDWNLVILRYGPTDWMLPHNQNIIILPAAVYQLSLSLFGMTSLPLHLISLPLFLASVVLLFFWMRPLVGDPASVLGCAVVLFLGAAIGDVVSAFQMGYFGSAVGGLGALLLLRRNTRRSDTAACVLLVFSTLCSTLMAPFLAGAAVELLFRDQARPDFRKLLRDSWVVVVPLLLYLAWWIGWNMDGSQQTSLKNALELPLYLLAAFGFAGASLTGLFPLRELTGSYLWVLPGIAMAIGFLMVLRRRHRIPPEFLVGLACGLGFWGLCGLNHTAAREFFTSRYQYPGVVFLLMMLAGAFHGYRPSKRQLKWMGGLAAVSIAINVFGLIYAFNHTYKPYEVKNLVSLAVIDLSWDTVSPDFRVGIGTDGEGDQISARDYKAAVNRYGRPPITEALLEGTTEKNRDKLDQLMVLALPVGPVPDLALTATGKGCRTLSANPQASDKMVIAPGTFLISSQSDTAVRLARYGSGPGALAWSVGAGKPLGYRIPADRSSRPWRIGFQGRGEVTVCPARPA